MAGKKKTKKLSKVRKLESTKTLVQKVRDPGGPWAGAWHGPWQAWSFRQERRHTMAAKKTLTKKLGKGKKIEKTKTLVRTNWSGPGDEGPEE
jgi:hypothetical protein